MSQLQHFFAAALDRSKPFLLASLRKSQTSLVSFLDDTALLTDLAEGLHGQAPFFAKLVIGRKTFVRFVLTNRDRLAPLIASAAAASDARAVAAVAPAKGGGAGS